MAIEEKGKKEFEESFEETKESTPNNRVLKKTRSQESLRIDNDEHKDFQKNKTKENQNKHPEVKTQFVLSFFQIIIGKS